MNMWVKASTASSRPLSQEERARRRLSLRRLTCKPHTRHPHVLALIHYGTVLDSYDDKASDVLVLCLVRNTHVRDAVENRILDAFDSEGDILQEKRANVEFELLELAQKALPYVERFYITATRVVIRTESDSKLTFSTSEEDELVFPLSNVPRSLSSLHPPTVQIADLKRIGLAGRFGLSAGIDRVHWKGREGVFAFKRTGRDTDVTSHEIGILLQSPLNAGGNGRILKLSAVVIDPRNRLRGFLSPFEPYGSIEEVFSNGRQFPVSRPESGEIGSTVFPRQPEWKDKLRWAAQLARGVATLHDGNVAAGPLTLRNLNPRNVLVSGSATSSSCRDTYLVFAGLRGAASPTGMRYSKRWAAPERLRRPTYEIGTALDVANLGMVLWALAEENFDGFPDIYSTARRDSAASTNSSRGGPTTQGRSDLWQKDNPATPGWYRLLIESCVEEEPARRPKAAEVAAALERQLQFLERNST
ncbi:uncharacterized protein FOMMEDRAFT_31572 [Fomitiporia mediterranea MF3/22]|uniref:uncharacterized protein n=1 Tax=Fomitiporia mediterranea (strain MF3/22) TaxID=694068 RepID=UPI0004409C69|nr:uncharacterized protein FOMMEDRAFT_31572 [Fomitiporia mediterranea MF3/22]EJC99038.1 hypothetical protein FOMMEDRAFT_31572 [Fomitiporia mediterranea MF3/22]